MDRQTRRNIKHDRFVDEVSSVAALVKENKREVAIGLVVVLVIAGAVLGWTMMKRSSEAKAQARLAEGIEAFQSPLPGSTGVDPKLVKYKSEKERDAAAEAIFKQVMQKYSGTDAADVADLFIGQIEAEQGDYAKAEPRYVKFIRTHQKSMLATSARIGLYELRMANGSVNDVIRDLRAELRQQNKTVPADVLLALLARAYEVQGDTAKAHSAWQRIVNEFPDSPYGIDAQRKLAQG